MDFSQSAPDACVFPDVCLDVILQTTIYRLTKSQLTFGQYFFAMIKGQATQLLDLNRALGRFPTIFIPVYTISGADISPKLAGIFLAPYMDKEPRKLSQRYR
jgi:hypothetical protein